MTQRRRDRARVRTEVIRAAYTLFLGPGGTRVSLAEVAEAAGYTKGAVYSSFRSKNELSLAVLDIVVAEAMSQLESAVCPAGSPQQRWTALVTCAHTRLCEAGFGRLVAELAVAGRADPSLRTPLAATLSATRSTLARQLAVLSGVGTMAEQMRAANAIVSMSLAQELWGSTASALSWTVQQLMVPLPAVSSEPARDSTSVGEPSERPPTVSMNRKGSDSARTSERPAAP